MPLANWNETFIHFSLFKWYQKWKMMFKMNQESFISDDLNIEKKIIVRHVPTDTIITQ